MTYKISVGKSCKDTNWKIKEFSWPDLVRKLEEVRRTPESFREYSTATRGRKTEIKDVGGFVGGVVEGGRRVRVAVTQRSLLTLDLDYAQQDATLSDVRRVMAKHSSNFAVYSTHSHTEEKPRYRLVVPLSRAVDPDEHEAVARKIAEEIGIDYFDDTTYQTERLMFWPSASKDGAFYSEAETEREELDVKEILDLYHDWRDVSQWPTSSRTDALVRRELRKQQDPTEKEGVIGAFCRAHDIYDVIDLYLTDIYTADSKGANTRPKRYTYVHGSSACGLVIYEDGKFAYSNHATDPASGHLCNAFDLVRVHKFGPMDEDAKEGTPSNRLPSYLAMLDFCKKDEETQNLLNMEQCEAAEKRLKDLAADFEADDPEGEETPAADEWKKRLTRDDKGRIEQTDANALLIILNCDDTRGLFRYDYFTHNVVLTRDYHEHSLFNDDVNLVENDVESVKILLQAYKINMGHNTIIPIIEKAARRDAFHPVREYFDSLSWDGVPRLETVFIDYNGVIDTPAIREASRIALTAAVARIFRPGCKFDYVVTLAGPEKVGKSKIIKKLALEKWDQEGLPAMNNSKESSETLNGVMLVEIAELSGMRKSKIEDVKSFISRCTDKYRPAYKRLKETHKRQCIFIANTNETSFLKGSTGNRRWWIFPIPGKKMYKKNINELSEEIVGQIWAEAIENYKHLPLDVDGKPILELSEASELEMEKYQNDYNEITQDDDFEKLRMYLDGELIDRDFIGDISSGPVKSERKYKVCAEQICKECFETYSGNEEKYKKKIKDFMAMMPDWKKKKVNLVKEGYSNRWGWMRK